MDDYGDESHAKLLISHENPNEVKRAEFDYYAWVYAFLEPEDLLFYLYPMVREFVDNQELECIDSYFYSMDKALCKLVGKLSEDETKVLANAFEVIWEHGGDDNADWAQCKNLQKLIGVKVEW